MRTLKETNPFLADPKRRRALLLRSAVDSSYFEGARGLRSKARRKASSKRPAKGS